MLSHIVPKVRVGGPAFRLLFLCARASCRSPMAAGFAEAMVPPGVNIDLGGLQPRGRIDPMAIHVMTEAGVDISKLASRAVRGSQLENADLIVVLRDLGEDLGPLPFAEKTIEWIIEDPLGWPADIYEDVRGEIKLQVERLAEWLRVRAFEDSPRPIHGGKLDSPFEGPGAADSPSATSPLSQGAT